MEFSLSTKSIVFVQVVLTEIVVAQAGELIARITNT